MGKQQAIVIGAGIVGLATARSLALKGYFVKVFERNHRACGASVRNFGMIWPIGQPSGKLYDLAMKGLDCWKSVAKKSDLWYDPVGSLHVAHHNDEWQVLQELFEVFSQEGRDVELLAKDQVLARSGIALASNCKGGLYSSEEIIIDPRQAMTLLPSYLHDALNIDFYWGKTVTAVETGAITVGSQKIQADLIIVCSGADFETLYPEEFAGFPLTKCKLQMMRFTEEASPRIGPAVCGGLSLIHYTSFKAAPSLDILKKRFHEEMPDYIKWGIHVMVAQNQSGELSVGDSHEYGLSPDPFDRQFINDLILDYFKSFTSLKNARLVETWNGVYPKLTNGDPYLFYSPEPGVHIINAISGAGMTLSFGLAEDLVGSL